MLARQEFLKSQVDTFLHTGVTQVPIATAAALACKAFDKCARTAVASASCRESCSMCACRMRALPHDSEA